MKHLTLLALVASALLSGCATPYRGGGLTGGLEDDARIANLDIVTFSANGYTAPELTQRYTLFRSAELAKSQNKPFFLMYASLLHAAYDKPSSEARVGTALNKPIATAFVRLLDGPAPGAHNTQDVLEDLRKTIEQKKVDAK